VISLLYVIADIRLLLLF